MNWSNAPITVKTKQLQIKALGSIKVGRDWEMMCPKDAIMVRWKTNVNIDTHGYVRHSTS